jgi:hypothetical protein
VITTKADMDRELTRMWDDLRAAELAGETCRAEMLARTIDRLLERRLAMA